MALELRIATVQRARKEANMKTKLELVSMSRLIAVVALLMMATCAVAQVETIDARARGTSTQMGKDREVLKAAFQKDGQEGLVKALSKMKSVGRLRLPSSVGGSIAYARVIPTPTGRKIRFVTDRRIAFAESAANTRSKGYDLTAGEIDINDQDRSKSTGVLYPAAQLKMNKAGELQFELFQNPWQLVNITDWKPKNKEQ